MKIDYCGLLGVVLQQYALSPTGTHGVAHWARVLENGRRLAAETGADPAIVHLFAILHDSRRRDDGRDTQHGPRAAAFAETLRAEWLPLSDPDFELLREAIARHTGGCTDGDATVRTCWDADRLDLYRVGIMPARRYLCTEAARDEATIAWAVDRSVRRVVPGLVLTEWGLDLPERRP